MTENKVFRGLTITFLVILTIIIFVVDYNITKDSKKHIKLEEVN